ncbi:hypothetical protein H6P81_021222 [Aristolochia fimbriata]|uniref:Uncharacterized protein n=1 Tax=Aristolochia fimbriata TaxID=158543 RepID=A0AAV7DQJ1_ARIFI|nr:hypothetical protein H6P81_021222 [Aristolochia fimbriata]
MPRWATGARCETPVESPRLAQRPGADGFQRQRPRRSGTLTHEQPLGRDLCQAKEEARGGPTSTRSRVHLPGRHARRAPPPRALLPHRWRCGRGRRGEQIGRPCPLARLAEKHFAPRALRTTSGGSAPPAPGGARVVSEALALRDPCRAVASGPRGLARIGTPGQFAEAPSSDGPGASPMEWGAREGDSPVVPDPVAPRGAVGEVGLFGNAAQIGRGWGPGDAPVRARDGESRSAADSGADRRWSRATQARRMIPPADTPPLRTEEGGATTHGRVPRGTCAALAPASGLPIRPALKHGPRSLTCVRSQRATKTRRTARGCFAEPRTESRAPSGPFWQGKSAKWIRKSLGKGLALRGWARGPSPQPAGLSVDCSKLPPRARAGRRVVAGDDWERPFGAFPGAEQPTQNWYGQGEPTA